MEQSSEKRVEKKESTTSDKQAAPAEKTQTANVQQSAQQVESKAPMPEKKMEAQQEQPAQAKESKKEEVAAQSESEQEAATAEQ